MSSRLITITVSQDQTTTPPPAVTQAPVSVTFLYHNSLQFLCVHTEMGGETDFTVSQRTILLWMFLITLCFLMRAKQLVADGQDEI